MRKRPLALIFCSLLFLYYPGAWIWKVNQGQSILLGEVIFSVVVPVLLLIGLIRVVKIGWYTLIAFGFLWGMRDLYLYYSSQGTSLTPILVHLFIYCLSLSYFINPRIRHLYFDPHSRWWRTKHRFETHCPAIVNHTGVWHYPILRNISDGGCFIETSHPFDLNKDIQLSIPLPVPLNVSVIKAVGEVRWVSKDPLRLGMGVQFKNLLPEQTKAIRFFVRKQL